MASKSFCQDCIQKHDCRRVYEQLGDASVASVVLKTVLAFLLPIVVFIVALAVSERILDRAINIEKLQIILSFLSALVVTVFFIFTIRMINKYIVFRRIVKH